MSRPASGHFSQFISRLRCTGTRAILSLPFRPPASLPSSPKLRSAFVDGLRYKREAIAIGVALLALGSLSIVFFHNFAQVLSAQIVIGIVGTFFPPAMAGMTLGIVGRAALDLRIGRNETFVTPATFSAPSRPDCSVICWRDALFFILPSSCALSPSARFFLFEEVKSTSPALAGARKAKRCRPKPALSAVF